MKPAKPATSQPTDASEPVAYGWRLVSTTQPDGSVVVEQVPLTLDDVLHPQEGDIIPERSIHQRDRDYLFDVFGSRPLTPGVVHVTSDLLIDWGVPGQRATAPDVAVFVGLHRQADLNAGTFHLTESGGRCVLVVEIVSPHTRDNDTVHKFREYHQARVPLYVIIDQQREDGPRRLLGYEWKPTGYQEVTLDERGRLLLAPLGLYLRVDDERATCEDAQSGRELGNYSEISRELEQADQRNHEQAVALEESAEQLRATAAAREQAETLAQARAAALEVSAEQLRTTNAAREEAERLAQAQAEQIRQLQATLAGLRRDP